jgi:hypothetical protein
LTGNHTQPVIHPLQTKCFGHINKVEQISLLLVCCKGYMPYDYDLPQNWAQKKIMRRGLNVLALWTCALFVHHHTVSQPLGYCEIGENTLIMGSN